jgi:ubiquinone/menaquinone biosynthesis C-methylase UbiE
MKGQSMKNTIMCGPTLLAPAATIHPGAMDAANIKSRQQAMWASGDFAVIGTTLQIVGEELCEAMDLRSGLRVLDVAAGNGTTALAAARRWCDVTASDYVPALLERARERAAAERLPLKIEIADAEALPFADESFDAVTSTFGAMFTPDHSKPAKEMMRVCREGGKIGLANWTPTGFIGELFKAVGRYLPPPAGMKSPALWGTPDHIVKLFGQGPSYNTRVKNFMFRYRSDDHWLDTFKSFYGPVLKAFESLDEETSQALTDDIKALIKWFNLAHDGTMVVPAEYLQVVIEKPEFSKEI